MRDVQNLLQVKPVREREHFTFNLYNFRFFRNSDLNNRSFFESTLLHCRLMVMPYILAMEFIHFRGTRHFVELNGQVVGIFVLREKSTGLYIGSLAVAPEYRRIGIATYILNYAGRIAKRLSKEWLELSVSKVNAPALRLYKKFGFTKKHEKKWTLVLRRRAETR